jgi:6-pyruvoyltetrahydropterin/6-carboxytetrahydropterin synthase
MPYQSTKTFGHELGLSACFRQHRAASHCSLLHGYALSFKFTFSADSLDDRNWVQDFGALKGLKLALQDTFDHKLMLAKDDPKFDLIYDLHAGGVANVEVLDAVGCEAFARLAFNLAKVFVREGVTVISCECSEHGANSAIYIGE